MALAAAKSVVVGRRVCVCVYYRGIERGWREGEREIKRGGGMGGGQR